MVQSMKPQVFTCCSLLLYYALMSCLAIDTLYINSTTLEESRGDTLVSTEGNFELGFFTPIGNSSNGNYLGIWYHNLTPRIVVWVANRDKPLRDSSGILAFTHDGKLQVLDESGKLYWSADTNERVEIRMNHTEAKLMDSGNFVLGYNTSTPLTPIWQSFEHHVDTLLPGMNLISSKSSVSLNSWREAGDPTPGNFSFTYTVQNGINQFVIQAQNDIVPHWKSTDETELFKSTGIDAPQNLISDILANVATSQAPDNTTWRLVMNSTGEIQYWVLETQQWILKSRAPRDRCGLGHGCGIFGSCNVNNKILCKCLPGFSPRYQEKWDGGDFSGGCSRDVDIGKSSDTFLTLVKMRVRKSDFPASANGVSCREQCLNTSACQAYTQEDKGEQSEEACLIWTEDLNYLQEGYNGGANILFVRVANSSIKPTARSCDPCGTDPIPYPLSTGSDCGESTYDGFQCDISSGKTSFTTPTGAYHVTRIEQKNRTFFVQVKEADDCRKRNKGVMDNISHLNQTLSSPFKLVNSTYWCDPKEETYGYNDSIGIDELQISWEPPPEPACTPFSDCKDWPNSKCKLSKDGHLKQCICNTNFAWNSSALNCTQGSGKDTSVSLIVGASIGGVVVVLSFSILFCWLFRRKLTKRRGREKFQNEALMHNTEKRIKELIDSQHFTEEDGKGIDVHFFHFDSILTATDNFSNANKLGQGGFGPVYKGKFPGGQEIAIKRLSIVSGQGLEEFKNEVVLIARLQHRNLVRLLGYCLKGDEKILLYEYMHNKSLDLFLFDSQHSMLLTWEKRFDIILGVARGLLYLHQDSRLRIVHRDLKTSNILLDEEMNPKISDFGLAKMVVGKQNEGSTERVIGTFGYMSPEYRLEGVFSVKSDVFSFGVVILEILSGKKNASYFNLLDYAWRLWKEDKIMELMEGTLSESCSQNEFLKCVNVALLCIEEHPTDRPNMSNVVVLLSSETETLPAPKKPACITRGSQNSPEPSSSFSSKHEALRNSLTMSEEGR